MKKNRAHCPICLILICGLCGPNYFDIQVPISNTRPIQFDPRGLLQEQQHYILWCNSEIKRLQNEIQNLEQVVESWKQKYLDAIHEELEKSKNEQMKFDRKGKGILIDEEVHLEEEENLANFLLSDTSQRIYSAEALGPQKKNKNMLYNLMIELKIPEVTPFKVRAILDTGATTCCIDLSSIPSDAVEPNPYLVHFSGINSKTTANQKLKYGLMIIEENSFRIPYTYAFKMTLGDNIQMILGCNFIRAMQGGVRIEGNSITFYKSITTIQSQSIVHSLAALEELDLDEEQYLQIREETYYASPSTENILQKFQPIIQKLKNLGYIGDDPLKHWQKNQVLCKLEIKNPDFIIEDRPLKHVTPALQDSFAKHIQALLKLKVIRASTSKHRTTAMIVKSGTSVDPKTGKEVKGKERMVFNYKRLNDITEKDQYSLPGINTILRRIGNSQIYSKFDLKSGFHQVAMSPESIPWTAFWVPGGLYEWLVMPFGLKNAPAIFQRKMDLCFKGTEQFIAVYILILHPHKSQSVIFLKYGLMIIEENSFRIPYTYAFKMTLGDNIQMILGCNFIRAMQGGVRIEGNSITFYKSITTIQSQPIVHSLAALEELDLDEEQYLQIREETYYASPSTENILQKFQPIIQKLKNLGYNCSIKTTASPSIILMVFRAKPAESATIFAKPSTGKIRH